MTSPSRTRETVAEWIRRNRTRIGLNQAALAKKIGAGKTTINQLESGRTASPNARTLAALEQFFGTPYQPWPQPERPHAAQPDLISTDAPATLGEWIAYNRKARGLNRAALAELLDLTPAAIRNWETGANNPSPESAEMLEGILGTTIPDYGNHDAGQPEDLAAEHNVYFDAPIGPAADTLIAAVEARIAATNGHTPPALPTWARKAWGIAAPKRRYFVGYGAIVEAIDEAGAAAQAAALTEDQISFIVAIACNE